MGPVVGKEDEKQNMTSKVLGYLFRKMIWGGDRKEGERSVDREREGQRQRQKDREGETRGEKRGLSCAHHGRE